MPNPYSSGEEKWSREVTNSKIARTLVAGGLLISFTLLITKDILEGTKNIIMKPRFRKKKNVGRSSDLY